MVDLFGKKKYEDRISELLSRVSVLDKEKLELTSNLEKRDEKIRKLTSGYQEANRALKDAEKRASLQPVEPKNVEPSQKLQGQKLGASDVEKLQMRLQAIRSPEDDLLSAYLKSPANLPPDAKRVAESAKSDRGIAVFHCPWVFTLVLVPPLPVTERPTTVGSTFLLDPITEFMETPVLVISLHAGDTFIGLALTKNDFEIQEIVESPVKEKHSKGGWSQKRFERLRDEDIRNHADAVSQRLKDIAGKYRSIARYAVVGGDLAILKMIRPQLDLPVVERRLEKHDAKRLDWLLNEVYGFTYYRC